MQLGLTRKAAGAILGVHDRTVENWEFDRHETIRPVDYPRIFAFLGYNPMPVPTTLGEAIRLERLRRGWTLARLAREADVDPVTIRRLEEGRERLGVRPKVSTCRCLSIMWPTTEQTSRLSAEPKGFVKSDKKL